MWMNSQFLAGRTLLMLRSFFIFFFSLPLWHGVEWYAWYNGNNVKLWTDRIFSSSDSFFQNFFRESLLVVWCFWHDSEDWMSLDGDFFFDEDVTKVRIKTSTISSKLLMTSASNIIIFGLIRGIVCILDMKG